MGDAQGSLGEGNADGAVDSQGRALEALREPLESGHITLSRAAVQASYPARFQLIAAMNPCPCGFLGDERRECACEAYRLRQYRSRLSGPLLDRIDLQIEMPAVTAADLVLPPPQEGSAEVAARVATARAMQRQRYAGLGARAPRTNAEASGQVLEQFAMPDEAGLALMRRASACFLTSDKTVLPPAP